MKKILTGVLIFIPFLVEAKAGSVKEDSLHRSLMPDSLIEQKQGVLSRDSLKKKLFGGQNSKVKYWADHIFYDFQKQCLRFSGNAKIIYESNTLTADTILYYTDHQILESFGNPKINDGKQDYIGDWMIYDIKNKSGKIEQGRTKKENTFFHGETIRKEEQNIINVDLSDYSTCSLDSSHYFFYGRRLKFIPDDKVIIRPAVLNIGAVPVAALPYYVFPIKRGRHSGFLTPTWGGSEASGNYLKNVGYYFAPNDYFDFLTQASFQSGESHFFQNWVVQERIQYALRYWLDGQAQFTYGDDIRLDRHSKDWKLSYSHRQNLDARGTLTLRGSGTLQGGHQFYTQAGDNLDERLQRRLNADLTLNKNWRNQGISLNVSVNQSRDLDQRIVDENFPYISLSFPSKSLVSFFHEKETEKKTTEVSNPAWFKKIYFQYNTRFLQRHHLDESSNSKIRPEEREYRRRGMEHNFSVDSPQKLFNFLEISPFFRFQESFYDEIKDSVLMDKAKIWHDSIGIALYDSLAQGTQIDSNFLDTLEFRYNANSGFINRRIGVWSGDGSVMELDSILRFRIDMGETSFTINSENQDRYVLIQNVGDYIIQDSFYVNNRWVDSIPEEVILSDRIFHREIWSTGISARTTLYGLFQPHWGRLKAIRHVLQPSVSFVFSPEYKDEFNAEGQRTRYEQNWHYYRFGIGQSPNEIRQRAIQVQISNLFQVKLSGKASSTGSAGAPSLSTGADIKKDLMNLNLSSSYNFEAKENLGQRKFSPLQVNASSRLFPNTDFNFSATYDFYSPGTGVRRQYSTSQFGDLSLSASPYLQQYNMSLNSHFTLKGSLSTGVEQVRALIDSNLNQGQPLWSQRKENLKTEMLPWRINVTHHFQLRRKFIQWRDGQDDGRPFSMKAYYDQAKIYQLDAQADMLLTPKLRIGYRGRYDFTQNKLIGQQFNFSRDIHCWIATFQWTPAGPGRGYSFRISIKDIPDVKLEKRDWQRNFY